jgi:hypothetical protein
MLQHQLSKMEIDFALEPERWKSYSASALVWFNIDKTRAG